MTKIERIAELIENKLGYTNGWRISDAEYKQECLEVAQEILTEAKEEALHLPDVVGRSEQLPCDHEFTHKPLGGNVYCWKCCAMMPK